MANVFKPALKRILGDLPLTAEVYWFLRQSGKSGIRGFRLKQLYEALPGWSAQTAASAQIMERPAEPGKQVLVFGVLRYWIAHATLLGLALAGYGHKVNLVYLPYGKWHKPVNPFDLRRHNLYARRVFQQAVPLIEPLSLLDIQPTGRLPAELQDSIRQVARRDTQYTLQVEEIDEDSNLFRLRLERNLAAARGMLTYMEKRRPEVVIIPNGSILEFGAVYQVARYLDLPVVTYEFGEQRQRIWLAQNTEVMRQDTGALWSARASAGLKAEQLEQVRTLFSTRQRASLWENFDRRWQGVPSEGGEKARASLGLDQRPVVLLATNVIGDSLTLGRQVFSASMTEWLERTAGYFVDHPGVQLVVRIHPGELVTKGPSVAGVVARALPDLPENIHLVPAEAPVNTYDLVEIADLGLVYTTTVGMEMAMSGIPVIVAGQTHYRAKGFTLDPSSWEGYFHLLDKVLGAPQEFRLSKTQVDCAWEYAYRFFFEYPQPFPWHLVHLWSDVEKWPLSRVLSAEGQKLFGPTFRALTGVPVQWSEPV